MMLPRPRRLTPPAAPGSLLKTQTTARAAAKAEINYLALIRQLPCLYCGVEPCGEAAHVKFSSAEFGKTNALGRRPHDKDSVPLCRDDHQNARHAQHKGNEQAFWNALGISPYLVARNLWDKRGDLTAMRMVCYVAIAERKITKS